MKNILFFALVGLLVSCASSTGPSPEEAAANRARPYNEGMQALAQYQTEPGCDGPANAAVSANLADVEIMTVRFNRVGGTLAPYAREAKVRHQNLAFGYADAALGKNCLNTADRVYRSLITLYIGTAYAGIRDRARIGIDDVRAKR